jgi:hypothetical protein
MYPFWVSEGLATNFEFEWLAGPGFTNCSTARHDCLVKTHAAGDLVPLRQFVVQTKVPASASRSRRYYAQAWAFFQYLLTERNAYSEGALLSRAPDGNLSVASPARVAERLNRQFPMDRSRQYFTFVYGVVDAESGVIDYVIAGHPAPVLVPGGDAPVLVAGGGLPIGMLENAVFEDGRLTLEPGDRLYLYTDGVIEALDATEREYGLDRLLAAIERCRALPLRAGIDAIAAEVRDWCSGRLRDDVSVLAVEREA